MKISRWHIIMAVVWVGGYTMMWVGIQSAKLETIIYQEMPNKVLIESAAQWVTNAR